MSEDSSNIRRSLFWLSVLAGGVCLLLVGGYYGGKLIYGTVGGVDRPGFRLWEKTYSRVLFHGSIEKYDYRYSDLNRDHWITARLVEHEEFFMQLVKSDGSPISLIVPDPFKASSPDMIIGRDYRIKLRLLLKNSSDIAEILGMEEYFWYVEQEVIEMHLLEKD